MANINEIINYGIQNKKRKDEILSALLQAGADIPSATNTLKALNESGVFEYDPSTSFSDTPRTTPEELDDITNKIDVANQIDAKITSDEGFGAAVGFGTQKVLPGWIKPGEGQFSAGSKAAGFEALHNQLIGQLKLEEREKLKGTGQISDSEQKILGEAVAALNLDLPEEEYKKQLAIIKGILNTAKERKVGNQSFTQQVGQAQEQPQSDALGKFNATLQYAQQNPTDERSQKFLQMIKEGKIDPTTGQLVDQQTTPLPQSPTGDNGSTEVKDKNQGIVGKIGETLGNIFGGKYIGEAIGSKIAELTTKDNKVPANVKSFNVDLETGEIEVKEKDEEPTERQLLGDALQAGLAFAPIGKAASVITKGAKAIGLTKGASTIGKIISGGATGAGFDVSQNMQEKEGDTLDLGAGTAIGTAIPIFGAGLRLTGGFLKKGGQKIQGSVIKPSAKDMKDGFNIDNIEKYDVGGSLGQTLAKTNAKINLLGQELKKKIGSSGKKINLNEIYENVANKLTKENKATFGDNKGIERVLNSLKEEISQISKTGEVDVVGAQQIKRAAGTKGSWSFGVPDPDARATETIYNSFYNEIKKAIEKASPEGVKEINKKLSELIPISNAVLRRIPVAERNNAISLTDVITLSAAAFDPKALGLTAINKLSKSGKVGELLTKAGQKLKGASIEKLPGDAFWESKAGKTIIEKIKKTRPGLNVKEVKDAKLNALFKHYEDLNKRWQNASAAGRKTIEKGIKSTNELIRNRFKELDKQGLDFNLKKKR